MMKKKLELLKRGICLTLAGAMILCSDHVSYAATTSTELVSETEETAENMQGLSTEDAIEETSEKETENITEEESEDTEDVTEEETEEPSEDDFKEDRVPSQISLNGTSKYQELSIGEEITLPEYTIAYANPNEAGADAVAEWSDDGLGIVTLDKGNNKVKGQKAGVTALKLQIKNTTISTDYYVVVAPKAPLSATMTGCSYDYVEMSWAAVTDAAGYIIYRKAENEAEFKEIACVDSSVTAYKDVDAVAIGNKYTYRIKSYTKYQDETGATKYAQAGEFAQITAAPTIEKVLVSNVTAAAYNSVVINWNAVDGAEGYTVFRAIGASTSFAEVASVGAGELQYTDNTVSAGTTYNYKVGAYRIVNGNKVYGEYSDSSIVKPMPTATKLTSEVKGVKSIKLTWEAVGGADGYAIYRKVSGQDEFKNIKTVSGGSKVSYTDNNVKTGTKYVYVVRAYCNVNGEKVWAENSNETVAIPTIAAPKEVKVSNVSYNSIKIEWSKVSKANGYKVMRATSPNGSYKTVATIKADAKRTYTNKKLSYGKTYYYKVCAYTTVNGKKIDGVSSEIKEMKAVPTATTVKTEAAGATAIKLTWSKVELPSKNSGYRIYQIVDGQSKKIKGCGYKTTSYTIKNLTPGANYTYKVVPYVKNSSGKIVLGLDSNILTTTPQLLPVTIESAQSNSDGSMKLTWKVTADAGEDTYLIYRATSKKGNYSSIGSVARQNGIPTYSFDDTSVSFGKKYYYKIMCTRTLPDGTIMKSKYSAIKAANAAPAAPSLTVSAEGSEMLKLTWKEVKVSSGKSVNGYAIYRSNKEKGTYKKIKTINSGKTTSYTDKGLTTGNTYYYKIRAFYKTGGKTIYSQDSDIVAKQVVPSRPVIETASVDFQTARISWKQVTGCSGYQIQRSDAFDGKYKSVKTINSATTLSYDDSKLTTGKTYYYKVRAFVKKNGKKIYGEYSDIKAVTPVLGAPTELAGAAIDNNQIKLTWNAVPGAQNYTIVRSTKLDGKYKTATELCNTNSYIDNSVSVGKTYYYKVKASRDDMESEFTSPIAVMAATLDLSTTSLTMKTGTNTKVTATVKPATPNNFVAWSSDKPQVAVVTSDGTIYALKEGTATISATAYNITKKITVTVKDTLGTENKGLEISSDNGTVDFKTLRASGYEYVMLRISSGTSEDKNFKANLKAAREAGLKVGAICHSKAQSKTAAVNEAKKVLSILNGEKLEYPVVYELDDMALLYNNVTKTERVDFVNAFRSEIANSGKGYQFILGISMQLLKDYPTKYIDTSLLSGIDLWIYNCRAENLGHGYQGTGNVVMWRYAKVGNVNGVKGEVYLSNRYKAY